MAHVFHASSMPTEPHNSLSTEPALSLAQEVARLRFEALVADPEAADGIYDSLPESRNGTIISTDLARLLDESYRVQVPGTVRDMLPSWRKAWVYAQNRLHREISVRRGRKLFRMMAGGWAAGKTYALQRTKSADLSWDGTLADPVWAAEIILFAVSHGWKVQVAYVQRPIELACKGALERGVNEGRMVPLIELPGIHASVQASVMELERRFRSNAAVDFLLLHNPGTLAHPADVTRLRVADIAPGGRLHYSQSNVKDFQETARRIWQEALEEGGFPRAVLEAASQGMGR